jgi:hypothetical protein
MSRNGYTFLGWVVWQLGSRVAKHQIQRNQTKIGAAGLVLLVLIAGVVAAAKSGSDD